MYSNGGRSGKDVLGVRECWETFGQSWPRSLRILALATFVYVRVVGGKWLNVCASTTTAVIESIGNMCAHMIG